MKVSRISMNARAHDNICAEYENLHGEIFNPVEQERLKRKLSEALAFLETPSGRKLALDYGCGTGNLTRHQIPAGVKVVSADVSKKFLDSVEKDHSGTGLSETLMVNGRNLSGIQDGTFDIVATYSVLHHVPDYLSLVMELYRVTKRGGGIYIDHELNDAYWQPDDK
jgi:ubiquinone/menaquinone biosynthesis C-methylase UbiE